MDEAMKRRIEGLSDDDLNRMVFLDTDQYTDEALELAEAEMRKRGLELPYESDSDESATAAAGHSVSAGGAEDEEAEGEGEEALQFQIVRGSLSSWESLCKMAARIGTRIGRDRVVSISHSEDSNEAIITIWYWA